MKRETRNGRVIKGKKICAKCFRELPVSYFVQSKKLKNGYKSYCKECKHVCWQLSQWCNKMEFVLAYGGKCQCCGETELEFLTLEHIDGKGSAHRKKVGKGSKQYKDLKKKNYPKDKYTVLCFNCNWSERYKHFKTKISVKTLKGFCPHKSEYKQYVNEIESKINVYPKRLKDTYLKLKAALNDIH